MKPYVKRQKNDAADAEAICEAVGRPTMRFVSVKTALVSKGHRYLRQMLVVGALAVIRLCAAARQSPAVAGAVGGTAHDQGRGGRARQQDGAHHLGDHDHR